jgi:leucyl-tRNA synthetase
MEYNFKEIESNWQAYWAKHKTFAAKDGGDKPKYYVLDMFPYPSGAGLHVGHPLGYIASDIIARYKRHKGFNVLHPMGYDSFGLPAEQYAIQTGQHPKITTEQNIARYREQLDKIGFSFDWDREVRTSDPEYYKWTQWIFIQIFNSWYNPRTDKAENIQTLISVFETEGFKGLAHDILTGDIEKGLIAFTPEEWKNFDEKKRSDVLMNFRLAYLGESFVNWCPALGTVLANDEIKDGVSERGGHPVERKMMKQWSMRITAYAQRLLEGLDELEWTESLKEAQRNWIGRSEGSSMKFEVESHRGTFIEVFTTRPDTIFGVAYVAIAPEHELVSLLTTVDRKTEVEDYVTKAKNRSERERQADVNKVTGVYSGSDFIHPLTGEVLPIWIADYVLAGYGTGAVMAVPAHDERDFKFANHFDISYTQVIEPTREHSFENEPWTEKEGTMKNSMFLDGLGVKDAIKRAIEQIEKEGLGKGKVNYRLRDAVFGRQRYWGEPIPVYYKNDIPYVLEENELPLVLPEVDKYLPTEDGEPPLARASSSWKKDGKYEYEYSTMPGWAGSSWYFLRYMDANNKGKFASKDLMDYWKQVDLYIGGSEHATGHLLYVRFWTKILKDLNYIAVDEPAKKLINQGMIQGLSEKISFKIAGTQSQSNTVELWDEQNQRFFPCPVSYDVHTVFYTEEMSGFIPGWDMRQINVDVSWVDKGVFKPEFFPDLFKRLPELEKAFFVTPGGYYYKGMFTENPFGSSGSKDFRTKNEVEKMSKSKWNVVTPDDIAEKFGADTLRLYEMFLGPLEQSKPWNTNGITGVHGFLKKLWRLFYSPVGADRDAASTMLSVTDAEPTKAELKTLHKTIKKITEDIERFSFNTSVSNFMICVNELTDAKCNKRAILEPLLICLSPYAPHITEELWKQLGYNESIALADFPTFNEAYLVDDNVMYPVSFNGKVKFNLELAATLSAEEVEAIVRGHENTVKFLDGKEPKKVIVVHKRIVNMVV